MIYSILWMFFVGYFVNSLVLSKFRASSVRSARSVSLKSSLISALFSVVFTWYFLSWIFAFLGKFANFIGSRLLIFSGVTIVYYCCSAYFLSDLIESEGRYHLQLWLLLAHIFCGIIGFWMVDVVGEFLLIFLATFI